MSARLASLAAWRRIGLVGAALLLFLLGAHVGQRALLDAAEAPEFSMTTVIDPSQPLPANWRAEVAPGVNVYLSDEAGRLDLHWGFANCVDGRHRFTLAPMGPTYDLSEHLPAEPHVMELMAHEIYPSQWQALLRFRPVGQPDHTLGQSFITPRGCDWDAS